MPSVCLLRCLHGRHLPAFCVPSARLTHRSAFQTCLSQPSCQTLAAVDKKQASLSNRQMQNKRKPSQLLHSCSIKPIMPPKHYRACLLNVRSCTQKAFLLHTCHQKCRPGRCGTSSHTAAKPPSTRRKTWLAFSRIACYQPSP